MKKSLKNLQNKKTPLVCLTAYTYPIAKILDEYCDIILVGDSLGMTIYGHENTLSVTTEMMINHGKAVTRATKKAFTVVDLPFGSYEKSPEEALKNAQKILKETGCDAVKLESGPEMISTVKFLTENKIPVMGHVGLMPQHVKKYGGYKYQGRDDKSAEEILQTAIAVEKAGAFALVIEGVPAKLAEKITKAVNIPTIGIGASEKCDGQILVIDDLLGLNTEFKPKFVKNYSNLAKEISTAVKKYSAEVTNRKFPSKSHIL